MKNIFDELFDSGLFRLTRITDVGDKYRKAMEHLMLTLPFRIVKRLTDKRQNKHLDRSEFLNKTINSTNYKQTGTTDNHTLK